MDDFAAGRERRRRTLMALNLMVDDVRRMIARPARSVRWTLSRNDLIDLIDSVWAQRAIPGADGRPMTRKEMARRAFRATGLRCPARLDQAVWDLRHRRPVEHSMMRRYVLKVKD